MSKVLIKNGVRLYPVCGFQRSQHKLYYWETKAQLRVYEIEESENVTDEEFDEAYEELEFWQDVLEYANCVYNGLIYMPYKYYNRVKEAITMYDLLH